MNNVNQFSFYAQISISNSKSKLEKKIMTAFKLYCEKCLQIFGRFYDDEYIFSLIAYHKISQNKAFRKIQQETQFTIQYILIKWKVQICTKRLKEIVLKCYT